MGAPAKWLTAPASAHVIEPSVFRLNFQVAWDGFARPENEGEVIPVYPATFAVGTIQKNHAVFLLVNL